MAKILIVHGWLQSCDMYLELKNTGHISILESEKQIAGVVKSILN